MNRKRGPARNPALAPLGRWPRHLRPQTPCRYSTCSRSSSASSAPACEEASVQFLGLHTAGLTNPPLYRKRRCHKGRALLSDLHPLGRAEEGEAVSPQAEKWFGLAIALLGVAVMGLSHFLG